MSEMETSRSAFPMPSPPSPADLGQASREVLRNIGRHCGRRRTTGGRRGRSLKWILRQLRENKSVDLEKVGKALDGLTVPPVFFLEEIAGTLPAYEPPWLLQHFRPPGGARDPWLAAFGQRFRRLLNLPLAPGARGFGRHREIAACEAKHLFDRASAQAELDILGRDLLAAAETAAEDHRLTRGHLADCARFLRAWGAMKLAGGAYGESTDGYELAYRFAVAAGDALSLGSFYHDASHQLLELGQPGHALRFAERAAQQFAARRDRSLLPKALLQLSRALAGLGRHGEARAEAVAALRVSARGEWSLRTAAWLQLARLATGRGSHRRAFGLLRRALANARAPALEAFVHGRLAVALVRLGQKKAAIRAFRDAVELYECSGEYFSAALLAVDLAEALVEGELYAETLELVRTTAPRFERLAGAVAACVLWIDLCALIASGRRDGIREEVGRVREALVETREGRAAAAGSGRWCLVV
jgi:tetratricopeptide (TPR) repeat protein